VEHFIHPGLLNGQVKVVVVGAGGTGSQVITGLAQLDRAMRSLGHPGGLHVTVVDDDTVSEANVGRQMFWPSDVGLPKAEVLVHRINLAMGLNWDASVRKVSSTDLQRDIVVGCVDNRAARKTIYETARAGAYWLDIGNRAEDGQCILGELPSRCSPFEREDRLPTVAEFYPEVVDPSLDGKDDTPSCSLAEALEKQGLFVNRGVSLYALNLLWRLFRHGRIDYHGVFMNLATGRTAPLPVDPATWERMGVVRTPQNRAA
jgi:PRTRC genetic system ThiF family protein